MGYLLWATGTVLFYLGFAIFRKMNFALDDVGMWFIVTDFIFGTMLTEAGIFAVMRKREKKCKK